MLMNLGWSPFQALLLQGDAHGEEECSFVFPSPWPLLPSKSSGPPKLLFLVTKFHVSGPAQLKAIWHRGKHLIASIQTSALPLMNWKTLHKLLYLSDALFHDL